MGNKTSNLFWSIRGKCICTNEKSDKICSEWRELSANLMIERIFPIVNFDKTMMGELKKGSAKYKSDIQKINIELSGGLGKGKIYPDGNTDCQKQ
jgi:hypothetical protein